MAQTSLPPRMRLDGPRLAAGLAAVFLTAACAAAAVHWGLRIWREAHVAPPPPRALTDWDALASQAARLYPAPHVAAASTQFRLWGVIGGGEHAGAALIGIDGGAPQAYPAGALVAQGVRLVETGFGRAVLLRNGTREVLQTSPGAGPAAAPPGTPAAEAWPAEGRPVRSGANSAAAEAAALRAAAGHPG